MTIVETYPTLSMTGPILPPPESAVGDLFRVLVGSLVVHRIDHCGVDAN